MADKLPIELKNKIINYTNVVTFFKGKYYNKISSNDKRYEMLKKVIKLPIFIFETNSSIQLIERYLQKDIEESYSSSYKFRLVLTYYKNKNNICNDTYMYLTIQKIDSDYYLNNNKIIRYTSCFTDKYIFSKENKWEETVNNYFV